MKITDEILSKVEGKCTFLDDKHVILKKSMPVKDDMLVVFLNNMIKARNAGINLSCVLDYKLISDINGYGYSIGYFLEERAPGKNINELKNNYNVVKKDGSNIEKCVEDYFEGLDEYIREFLLRVNASQEIYDKFLDDYMKLYGFGLVPDPKPLNFFFDPSLGYTIIDPIDNARNINPIEDEYVPSYIAMQVFGYRMPCIAIQYDRYSLIPEEYSQLLQEAVKIITDKLVISFRKKGYSVVSIDKAISNNVIRIMNPLSKGLTKKESILPFIQAKYNEKIEALEINKGKTI